MIYSTFIGGITYWIFFLYLFFISVLESIKQFKQTKIFYFFITIVTMILFIGLRWKIGTDWEPYKYLFNNIKSDSKLITLQSVSFDPGYVIFNLVIKYITDNYTIFLLINSFVTIFVLCLLLKRISPYPNLSLFYFYALFMVSQFMGSNRRMMAMTFLLWAIYYLFCGKKFKYALLLTISFFFHRSSIIGLLLLFLPKKRFSIKWVLVILTVCLIVGTLQLPFKIVGTTGTLLSKITNSALVNRMVVYSQENDVHVAAGAISNIALRSLFGVLKRCVILIICIHVISKNKIDPLTGFLFNVYILGFGIYVLFVGVFFQVVAAYFILVEVILVARIYRYAQANTKCIILMTLFVYAVFQLVNTLNTYPKAYIPYHSVFNMGAI